MIMSHPTWVRGLKLASLSNQICHVWSHPTWVRGLKPLIRAQLLGKVMSHPTWVRGLKHDNFLPLASLLGRTLRGCVD